MRFGLVGARAAHVYDAAALPPRPFASAISISIPTILRPRPAISAVLASPFPTFRFPQQRNTSTTQQHRRSKVRLKRSDPVFCKCSICDFAGADGAGGVCGVVYEDVEVGGEEFACVGCYAVDVWLMPEVREDVRVGFCWSGGCGGCGCGGWGCGCGC